MWEIGWAPDFENKEIFKQPITYYPTIIINNRISYITIPCYIIRQVTLKGPGKGENFLIETTARSWFYNQYWC